MTMYGMNISKIFQIENKMNALLKQVFESNGLFELPQDGSIFHYYFPLLSCSSWLGIIIIFCFFKFYDCLKFSNCFFALG